MHRFYAPPEFIAGDVVRLPEEAAGQVRKVLRLKPGETIVVFDGGGREEVLATLDAVTGGDVTARIVGRRSPSVESNVRVTLCQALIKPDMFELVLQKGTELGAAAFQPVITERVQGGISAVPSAARQRRWERIVIEAAEQSGRLSIPEVRPPLTLHALVPQLIEVGPVIVLWEEEATGILAAALDYAKSTGATALNLVVGPAGGLTNQEVDGWIRAGAIAAGLGGRILRAETAALAALSATMYHLGELGG